MVQGLRVRGFGGVRLDTWSSTDFGLSRFRVQGFAFWVQGFEFRVSGFGFRV
jgi:hypothetical protein